MAFRKFNLCEYRKRTGKEKEAEVLIKTKEQNVLRAALANKNITLVPIDERKKVPNHQVRKIKQIEHIVKSNRFFDILIAFQSIPGIRQMQVSGDPIDYTNIFKTTALIVDGFLRKAIYTKGYVDFKKAVRVAPNLPDNFKDLKIDYSVDGLLEYIRRFEKIRNDYDYFPKNKKYIKTVNLATFIFGGLTVYTEAKPLLLTACLNEPTTTFQNIDAPATKLLKELYVEYISINKVFSYAETKKMAALATKLVKFSKVNNLESAKIMEEFFQCVHDWLPGTNYFFTEKMWQRFIDHLQKKGHSLKEESIIVVVKEKPVEEILTPRKRRKQLLIQADARKKEEKKKIYKPMNIKKLNKLFE